MSNAIQQTADKMRYQWEDAVREPVKLVRVVINPGDESMFEAFCDYLLALDSEQEEMVFVIDLPFRSPEDFARETVDYLARQVETWNRAEKPEELAFGPVDWQPGHTPSGSGEAALAVENLNRLVDVLMQGSEAKCCFVFTLPEGGGSDACREWFAQALALPFDPRMVWSVADIRGRESFGRLTAKYPDEIRSIHPDIDLDGAMEQLAEQAAGEERDDPAAANYRLALIRLTNSVKRGDHAQTDELARTCLDIALERVRDDINWISQFVTVYTLLYTDRLARKDLPNARYFADKAVEAAQLGEERLDPSLACRLLGNALLGKASVQVRETQWQEAAETYRLGADAYARCNDFLMQGEALRMSGWCWERRHEPALAAECYVAGFRLLDKLTPDLVKNSSYPLLLLSLRQNPMRAEAVSDEELERVLSRVLGPDWENYLYEYKRNLGKHHEMAE